ncbi:unnamed protein product [Clonostachys byssicola]|uniref:Choline transport protein n=1 Tax=Clonostachys byssicola TaxID=160290 RepID=A0A9N9UZ55_9HYPO|nr:unnamed protein product [Clonostachys byssicola]
MEHRLQADQKSITGSSKTVKAVTDADLERPGTPGGASFADGKMEVTHQFNSGTEMKKQFSSIATLGLAFSILNSWVGAAGSLLGPISLGGSVTAIWGCLAGAIFTTILCMGVIEMASAMPGAGGPYHYTFVLAWEHNRKFLSFFVGWCNMIAWWFVVSSGLLFMATFFTGMAVLYHPNYTPTTWHIYLIFVLILSVGTTVVIGANHIMSRLSAISLYCCLLVFLTCIVVPVAMHAGLPYQTPSFVFTNFSNLSGWPSDGMAFVIGCMLSCYNFIGIDATTHLSEEMPNPALKVPQAMAGALATGCFTSFGFLIALLFCVTDMDEVITTPTGVPILAIFYQSTNSKAVSVTLLSLIIFCLVFSVVSGILICGRTTWAFARDNGLPFSQYFSQVDEKTGMPLRATLLSSILCMIYGCIYVGSTVAFQSIVGSAIIMLFATYVIPQGILAIRGRHHLPARPFNLGRLGLFFNISAPILFVILTVFICFPYALPVTAQNMNYLSVIVVGCSTLIVCLWYGSKKGVYIGPYI